MVRDARTSNHSITSQESQHMYLSDPKFLGKCSCLICHKTVTNRGFSQHYFNSHTPEGQAIVSKTREKNKSFWKESGKLTQNQLDKLDRIAQYNLNPKRCARCSNPLEYQKQHSNQFCSNSCSAQTHNAKRGARSEETRLRISKTLKSKDKKTSLLCKISFCVICHSVIKNRYGKVCSRSCQNKMTSQQRLQHPVKMSQETEWKRRYALYCHYADVPVSFDEFKTKKQNDETAWTLYRKQCRFLFRAKLSVLEKVKGYDLLKNSNPVYREYSLDHMLSVSYGFYNDVDPTIIAHPANCEVLTISENSRKGSSCSITLEELKKRINDWNIMVRGHGNDPRSRR